MNDAKSRRNTGKDILGWAGESCKRLFPLDKSFEVIARSDTMNMFKVLLQIAGFHCPLGQLNYIPTCTV